jgi:hypothetical protein
MPVKFYADRVVETVENGVLDWETVARECLARMTDQDVEDMALECDWLEDENYSDDDNEDDDY